MTGLQSDELGFDADEFESSLVWIFGSMRGGSTWLLRMLCHPCVLGRKDGLSFSLPPDALAGPPLRAVPVNEMHLGHHLLPSSGEPMRMENGHYVPASFNFFWGSAPDYLMSPDYEDVWRREWRRFILIRLRAGLDRAAARFPVADDPRLIIKDVGASHAAQMTMSLLPRSRLLFLARDGCDVIDSLVDAAQPGTWFTRYWGALIEDEGDRLDFICQKARDWACSTDACTRALRRHPPELRRTLRYEDLLADTAAELARLCEWIGLPHDAGAQEAAIRANEFGRDEPTGPKEFARAATPGLWREHFSDQEREAAEEIMGVQLADLGYPVSA